MIWAINVLKWFRTLNFDRSSKSSEKFRKSNGVISEKALRATHNRSAYSAFPHSCFHGVTMETLNSLDGTEELSSTALDRESSVDNADSADE